MRFFYLTLQCVFLTAFFSAYAQEKPVDLNFEQALYEHLQGHYLKAITLSEVLSEKTDHVNIKQHVLLSSSYYHYRLPKVALDLLSNSLNEKLTKADEDILHFQIAKNYYHDKQISLALATFNKIIEPINPAIIDELHYLVSDSYIRKNELDKAHKIALKLQGNTEFFPFIAHNLAIAFLNNEQLTKALFWIKALNNEQYLGHQNLKDSLLLSTGIYYLRQKNYQQAIQSILHIKKESSFAAKGLLALGRSLVLNNNINEGKRFFNYLSNYPIQNIYYQESLLYVAESDNTDSAERLYKHAISNYDELLDQVDALSNNDIAEGLSTCLVSDIADINSNLICQNIHLWTDSFEQTEDFKAHLTQNNQLLNIQLTLYKWAQKLTAYQFILQQRKDDFDHKLPNINNQLKPEQLLLLKQEFENFKTQAQALKQTSSEFSIMNEDESDLLDDINYVNTTANQLKTLEQSDKESLQALQERAQFTKGILMWDLAQQKPSRLRQISKNLTEIKSLLNISHLGMNKLQQFNDTGDKRLKQLSLTLKQADNTLHLLLAKVDRLITKNKQQLSTLTQAYLIQRKATLIHLNSRSKFLLTQLQDVQ